MAGTWTDTWTDNWTPAPAMTCAASVADHVATFTGTVAAVPVTAMTWFELTGGGMPTQQVGLQFDVDLTAGATRTATLAIPAGTSIKGRSVSFKARAQSNGAPLWTSPATTLTANGYDNTLPAYPLYEVTHAFNRIEAIGVRGITPAAIADPLTLEVRLTTTALTTAIETVSLGHPRLRRLETGRWVYTLDASLLTPGTSYVANFRFSMQPGVFRVERETGLTFSPPPALPRVQGNAVIVGRRLSASGAPLSNQPVTVETYRDIISLHNREAYLTIETNAFGIWWTELPQGAVVRIIQGEQIGVYTVPAQPYVAVDELLPWQPSDFVRVDTFGYPLPGQAENGLFGITPQQLYPS